MQSRNRHNSSSSRNENINLRELIKKYAYHWKWFVLSILISLIFAVVFLKTATYEYQVSSTILINDEDNDGGSTSEISAFEDLGLFEGPKTSIDTEIGVLQSKALIERVVKELKLNISFYTESGVGKREVYGSTLPFKINIISEASTLHMLDTIFSISAKSSTKFDMFDAEGNRVTDGAYGEKITSSIGDLVVTPLSEENINIGEQITVKITPLEDVSIGLKKRIEVLPENPNSNLLILKLQDPLRLKAIDILNNLVRTYNQEAIEYKREIAKNTDEFVSNRIDDISVELNSFDEGVQTYKTTYNLSNLDSEAKIVMASNAELSKRIVELTSQIKLIDYVVEYMSSNKDQLIPANLAGLTEEAINYNNLVSERNRLLTSANEANPAIRNLNDQIANLRISIDQSLINKRSALKISLEDARNQERRLISKISANPKQERDIQDLQRQQEIYETLYLYLLQKKEENSISLAVTAPTARIIDKAYGSRKPVSPRKIVVLMASILIGFLIPVSLITAESIWNNKVQTPEELQEIVKTPFLGYIPSVRTEKDFLVIDDSSNPIVEPFRLLRTNVNFMLSKSKKTGQKAIEKTFKTQNRREVIENDAQEIEGSHIRPIESNVLVVSSTIRQEGKTFVAVNLAISMSMLNKKVLLIEADLKNPQVALYLNLESKIGLTQLVSDEDLNLSDLVVHHDKHNLDILVAGLNPLDSAEMLASIRFKNLIEESKSLYDLIIIDSSSINVSTDPLLIAPYADLFVYVVRANYLGGKMLQIPNELYLNKRLPNMALLMNGTSLRKRGYSSEFIFGQEQSHVSWMKRILS